MHVQNRLRSPYTLSMRATGGQYFASSCATRRISGRPARIRMRPVVGRHRGSRMRRVLERIVGTIDPAGLDRANLLADRDHGLDEAIELDLRLAFGRLDHQRSRHRKAHRRRVEPVVDQALRHILRLDAGRSLQRAQIENALVRDEPVRAAVQHRIVRLEAPRNVVGVQDRGFGRRGEPGPAHHRDVHPWDRQDRRTAERRGSDRADARTSASSPRRAANGLRRLQRANCGGACTGGRAGTARDAPSRPPDRRPDRHRRAGCRTSCAGSDARRPHRTGRAARCRRARSGSRRRRTPARRANGRSRRCERCRPRTRRASTDR